MAKKRQAYHHGDLREALIRAADEIIAEEGIEAFSLRTAARRAGVSPAAPAHHFGNARGLLTEVAILAWKRADDYITQAGHLKDAVAEVRAVSLAYIRFALAHPGHFRLMLRNDLVDRSDARLAAVSKAPGIQLRRALLRYKGKSDRDADGFDVDADMLCGLATLHGLAHLVLEDKAMHFFQQASPKNFVTQYLPRVVGHLYPKLG